ncbi:SMP-30/gluconolactonase/LRE family protein [Nocardiopsis tropica]|uniref:SMP-30/gluconolactonase/LRE family protein n=1 Tax=Nocardiopsis tropica TaxID=109330 RepID=A0ABU7L2P2_9ACTN|nr:SMP-30/gluconolactonase/LRE family protein [Nocardiopsis umidischolae]MEE2055790.1 SMP-30/gluconolactonase/LRE family protein [Nocardiopsis umidischolae]
MEPVVSVWSEDRFELGEGLRWVGGDLLMVDILRGRLLRLAPGDPGPAHELAALDVPLGAVAPVRHRAGALVAAAGTGIALLTGTGGGSAAVEWLGRPEDGAATPMRMNDGCCDPHGRFWAGSMAYDGTPGAGSLYRADPGGGVTRVLDGYTVPNGPAFAPDGSVMYLADSAEGRIDAYALDAEGLPGERTVLARVGEGSPDGMQVDAEGHLWVAVWGAGRVHRYAPDGALDRVVEVPAAQPTSVCVVGDGEPVLMVTSATVGLTEPGTGDGAVFALPVEVPAAPAHHFG